MAPEKNKYYETLYQGSVKNILRAADSATASAREGGGAVLFEYTDAYSVFDWGRMPDELAGKGSALAMLAADWFERLESAATWREFARSDTARRLASAAARRFGEPFLAVGRELEESGLRTHYLGVLAGAAGRSPAPVPGPTGDLSAPASYLAVREVSAVRPVAGQVLGRGVYDYAPTRASALPRLVPLEIVFRFSLPEGSSFPERAARDPDYLASLGLTKDDLSPGVSWDFPVMELFTKLEPSDRVLTLSEAVAISGVSPACLQEILFKTAWTAAFARWLSARAGVELADGKFEWGLAAAGSAGEPRPILPILVDAIGPDELRLLKDGVQLSKEFLRLYYRGLPWYAALEKAKQLSKLQGVSDWKTLVGEAPPALPALHREIARQLYPALTNALTGKPWFPEAWPLSEVVAKIRALPAGGKRAAG